MVKIRIGNFLIGFLTYRVQFQDFARKDFKYQLV